MATKITRQNISAPDSYIHDVKEHLNVWRFSSNLNADDLGIIHDVFNDREKAVVAAAAIAEARINRFNARGKK